MNFLDWFWNLDRSDEVSCENSTGAGLAFERKGKEVDYGIPHMQEHKSCSLSLHVEANRHLHAASPHIVRIFTGKYKPTCEACWTCQASICAPRGVPNEVSITAQRWSAAQEHLSAIALFMIWWYSLAKWWFEQLNMRSIIIDLNAFGLHLFSGWFTMVSWLIKWLLQCPKEFLGPVASATDISKSRESRLAGGPHVLA